MPNLIPTSIATPMLADKAKYATKMEGDWDYRQDPIFYTTGLVREGGDNYFDYINKDTLDLAAATRMQDRLNRGLDVRVGDLGLEDLYNASPSVATVPVMINPAYADTNINGKYSKYDDDITLAPSEYHMYATLAHEIQHALDQRGANNSRLDLLNTPIRNMEEYVKDKGERRAAAAETTALVGKFDEDGGRQRLYQVVKKGLPATTSKVEDAIINENVIKQILRRRSY